MLDEIVEPGEKGLSKGEVKARNFRAKLLGLIYEDLLEVWFTKCTEYDVIGRDVRRGLYKGRRIAVDFILEKDGRLYAVEAKCWPAYADGRLKKLTLNNIKWIRREFKTPFLEGDFVKEYRVGGRSIDGKILVWWDVDEAKSENIKNELSLEELMSIKQILHDIKGKAEVVKEYRDIVEKYKMWANQLFNALLQ